MKHVVYSKKQKKASRTMMKFRDVAKAFSENHSRRGFSTHPNNHNIRGQGHIRTSGRGG